ncbi:hypothetical protein M011DRAFT_416221 [Sporormia fimetaria CBS 119925]|uniref:Uncharacterized protein n=1 Tax=Sporormia fimetaria CBS 119925 TaxID=1340428 RepID=A0A6A6VQ94_9PLEO|nr:hypothetical protein M011DRAFT_416221 [Sporormia fimetaria CBS 119925]
MPSMPNSPAGGYVAAPLSTSQIHSWFLLLKTYLFYPFLKYTASLFGLIMYYLQPLLAVALTIFVVVFCLGQAAQFLSFGVQNALTPVCALPLSWHVFPFCHHPLSEEETGPDFDALMDAQSNFEEIVKQSQGATVLPQIMKQSEAAIRDLRTVVQYSHLPSKNELQNEFNSFIETARQATQDLIMYNSKVGQTVDLIISTNKGTLRVIEHLSGNNNNPGLIGRVIDTLNPMNAFQAPPKSLEERVFDQYLLHASANGDQISTLIQKSQALLGLLAEMDNQLDTIHQIAVRDNVAVSQNRDELLTQLWTRLGGNARERKGYEKQIQLLSRVTDYRHEAFKHVNGVLIKLQQTEAALQSLRESVVRPETIGYRPHIPLHHYLDSVERATERLQDVRGEARRVERLAYQAGMDRITAEELNRELPRKGGPVVVAKVKEGKKY